MTKSWRYEAMVVALMFLLIGCTSNEPEAAIERLIIVPVYATELKEEVHPNTLHYIGTIEPKETKQYSFKASGKIADVFVEEGQIIRKNDPLALLEQEEIHISELNVDKAQSNYKYIKDYFEKIEKLHKECAASEQDLNEAKLKLEQAEDSLKQAEKSLVLAQNGMLINADMDGYVLNVMSKKDEVVSAGYPVVVVSSMELKGRISLTQDDVSKIKVGDEVDMIIDYEVIKGSITLINKIPDKDSRTYPIDISIKSEKEINIGATIKVAIEEKMEKGIWIPVRNILNDGKDYVFVVENNRARRRNVDLGDIYGEKVFVEGLKDGEIMITQGIKSVKDGYEVLVEQDPETQ